VPFPDILGGKVHAKEASEPFLAAIRRYSGQAKEHSELKTPSGAGAGRSLRGGGLAIRL
jgi:hypothetical protein